MSETLSHPQTVTDGQHLLAMYQDLWFDMTVLDHSGLRKDPETAYEALHNTVTSVDSTLPEVERLAEIGRGTLRRLAVLESYRESRAQIESRAAEKRERIMAFLEERTDQLVTIDRHSHIADMESYRGGRTHTITGSLLSPSDSRYSPYSDSIVDNNIILWKRAAIGGRFRFARIPLRYPSTTEPIVDIKFLV